MHLFVCMGQHEPVSCGISSGGVTFRNFIVEHRDSIWKYNRYIYAFLCIVVGIMLNYMPMMTVCRKEKFFGLAVLTCCCVLAVLICSGARKPEKRAFIEENVSFAAAQTERMLDALGEPIGRNFPRRTSDDGRMQTVGMNEWTSGFFPGSLWYLYELTGDEVWRRNAEKWTAALEPVKTNKGTHDIGFMMYCSFGNAQRLAPDPSYVDILIESANSLTTRYNENVRAIKSWNGGHGWDGTSWRFPVIIDNMMNLELLCYASKVTGDPKYRDMAISHANTTLRNHLRSDFSTFHVVNYDENTGAVLDRQTSQGLSDNSTWSRGQAWAVYGYTMMYRETGNPAYLDAAKKMADWFIAHLPEDMVPYWDFNLGMEGYIPGKDSYAAKTDGTIVSRDASAAAVVCSALFELADLAKRTSYRRVAIKMLESLSSPSYRAGFGENGNFIIMHATGSVPHNREIDVALVYADYYYLEALARYKRFLNEK